MKSRAIYLVGVLTLALVCAGAVAVPVSFVDSRSVLADEDKDESGQGKGNEGRGGGKDDKGEDKDKGKDNDKDKGKGRVVQAAAYRVEVECAYEEGADQTTCTFTGVPPEGAKDVSHVDLPAAEVCAEVVGGEHEYVDPDPNTHVVGYKSKGSKGTLSLVMTGVVTPGGTATYWLKTGDGVFPATGQGLVCGESAEQQAVEVTQDGDGEVTAEAEAQGGLVVELQVNATEEAAPAAGAIVVQTYACAEEPASADFDWYGECEPGAEGVPFTLKRREGAEFAEAAEGATDGEGLLRFAGLPAGAYHLEASDRVWCHAESDHVDERGELVVEAGAEVTVWIFLCGAEAIK